MQDNLINPQSVNEVIQSVFGGYEKFVTNLIQRRKELEEEKARLIKRLKEIEKEESIIKNVLSGSRSSRIPPAMSSDSQTDSSEVRSRIDKINREEKLIQNVLNGFHGKKIGGQYYDSAKNSLGTHKPGKNTIDQADSFQAIAHYLMFRKDELNRMTGSEIIRPEKFYSEIEPSQKISLTPDPFEEYQNQISANLKNNYLPKGSDSINLDKEIISNAFKKGVRVDEFVRNYADSLGLKSALKGVKI